MSLATRLILFSACFAKAESYPFSFSFVLIAASNTVGSPSPWFFIFSSAANANRLSVIRLSSEKYTEHSSIIVVFAIASVFFAITFLKAR